MTNDKVKAEIERILDTSRIGVLSTALNNIPNSRYMVFYHDDYTLYTKTSIDSQKVAEFKDNPRAHVLIGYDETKNRSFLEIEAHVEILKDKDTIDWLWNNQDKTFFDSKDDPGLCVLKLTPKAIKIMNDDEVDTPQTITFD
ncbi:pyridoxamine 5'-phosphate oxidase family protein [Mammaliicoccus sciuri]|jgi:general stress protein 26|uniref:pyridoxamine 5'-phosphate oxidase family protein n=1 Tax=Mammaliicoccus sciuri TaxID=1296 RepID=UPI0018CB2CFC|nr:pyridoxamine 5'-phosphate oxidase family protein [Mammaliicoccus sciuri]MBG9211630.1 pyridoxamine 5'-phosphate oxidase family protein [Mammaliicoccus sciuri]MCI8455984.1 pyridoxamine 5'-phosphate oxidase family protein [Mammaliicoccus sciuri]MCJ0934986.1 pyridoxamine 5'-phosphate oxidase family protein [Mammaliicoccus sciuri]MDT0745013.1 pyridoxamine 5'-phosphate oxidase family protein [Mammaliicoccus sciuri]MDT0752782.1 pyridoxamine 5'-phosphate oxidase family protein [Mammaliicoccus sciur